MNLKTRSVDYVQAFPQATLPEGEDVYMALPDGYTSKSTGVKTCLKLKKNLYGLRQAAYNWNELLTAGLKKTGFIQSDHDPCLFMKDGIICVIYVDDTLFFAKDDSTIDSTIQ